MRSVKGYAAARRRDPCKMLGCDESASMAAHSGYSAMVYRHVIDSTVHVFDDLCDLLAKATPPRSGDQLAGIAAGSAEQMIAARMALADLPLNQILPEAGI